MYLAFSNVTFLELILDACPVTIFVPQQTHLYNFPLSLPLLAILPLRTFPYIHSVRASEWEGGPPRVDPFAFVMQSTLHTLLRPFSHKSNYTAFTAAQVTAVGLVGLAK